MWVFEVLSYTLKNGILESQRLFSHFHILLVLKTNNKPPVPNMFSVLILKRIFSNQPPVYYAFYFFFNLVSASCLNATTIHKVYERSGIFFSSYKKFERMVGWLFWV